MGGPGWMELFVSFLLFLFHFCILDSPCPFSSGSGVVYVWYSVVGGSRVLFTSVVRGFGLVWVGFFGIAQSNRWMDATLR